MRLIDANALKRHMIKAFELCGLNLITKNDVLYCIDNSDTVDAVEVVRCKDCTKISPSVTAVKNAVWCREFRAYMPCDGFCSYGERITDD